MKKVLVLAAGLSLFATTVFAAPGAVTGTAHDLSALASNTGGQICVFCHTPHYASTAAPLWNRGNVDVTAEAGYFAYTSSTFNADDVVGGVDYTVPDIGLCMTCHDGVMTDTLNNLFATANVAPVETVAGDLTIAVGSPALLGYDFRNDHPVGVLYNNALVTADNGGLVIETDAAVVARLRGGYVVCSSCHDVHKEGTIAGGDYPFLKGSTIGSALCKECHIK